jgi:hypothetical protein
LADENHDLIFSMYARAVSEFTGDLDFNGDPGKLFDPVLRDLAGRTRDQTCSTHLHRLRILVRMPSRLAVFGRRSLWFRTGLSFEGVLKMTTLTSKMPSNAVHHSHVTVTGRQDMLQVVMGML